MGVSPAQDTSFFRSFPFPPPPPPPPPTEGTPSNKWQGPSITGKGLKAFLDMLVITSYTIWCSVYSVLKPSATYDDVQEGALVSMVRASTSYVCTPTTSSQIHM